MTVRVSIIIPTYNRTEDLSTTLTEINRQTFQAREIIVVDDGSVDRSVEELVAKNPGVKYVRIPNNVGLIGARNYSVSQSVGEYIVNIDDDSWFRDDDGLFRAVSFLDQHPRIGVLGLNIRERFDQVRWPPGLEPFYLPYYTGCGNIYRRRTIQKVGPYISEFIRQGEEIERAWRVYDSGDVVVSLPSVIVEHALSSENRNVRRNQTFERVNYFRREILRSPLALIPFGLLKATVALLRASKVVDLKLFWKEFATGSRGIIYLLKKYRSPISVDTYARWQSMAWEYNRAKGGWSEYISKYRFPID